MGKPARDKTKALTKKELRDARINSIPTSLSEVALQRVSTGRVRFALSQLAQANVTSVQRWLDNIELQDGPKAAMELYLKMIEYSVPKLSRTVVAVEDADGNTAVAQLSMDELLEIVRETTRLENKVISEQ
ncbi:MAG: hypothetical protein V3S12_00890 [Acidiferrobacterales bacterium]